MKSCKHGIPKDRQCIVCEDDRAERYKDDDEDEEIVFQFAIMMSKDNKTANIRLDSEEPFTNRKMIEALIVLADEIYETTEQSQESEELQ